MDKERIIQEFVPGKQVTLAHLIAHPGEELAKKIGVPDAGAIGIMTLTQVGNGMPKDYDEWLAQINPYLEEKIGVNVDMEIVPWGDWDNRRSVITNRQRFRSLIKLYAL